MAELHVFEYARVMHMMMAADETELTLAAFRDANPRFFHTVFLPHYCSAPYLVTGLRGASREWRACIEAPPHMLSRKVLKRASLSGNLALCCLALSRGDCSARLMLINGAYGGWEHICMYLREPLDDQLRDLKLIAEMGYAAAKGGHVHICELARRWYIEMRVVASYETRMSYTSYFYYMMLQGAMKHHADIAILAMQWLDADIEAHQAAGQNVSDLIESWKNIALLLIMHNKRDLFTAAQKYKSFNAIQGNLVIAAAWSGNRELFDEFRAIYHGPINWYAMLGRAAVKTTTEFFRYLLDQAIADGAAIPFFDIVSHAASAGRIDICEMIRAEYEALGADVPRTIFELSASSNNEDFCRDAYSRCVFADEREREVALSMAFAYAGNTKSDIIPNLLCAFSREAGIAPDFSQMLSSAAKLRRPSQCIHIRKLAQAAGVECDYVLMFAGAMIHNNLDVCLLACKWLCESGRASLISEPMREYIRRWPSLARACMDAGYIPRE